MNAWEKLVQRQKEIGVLGSIEALLDWDEATYMPKPGANLRGEQRAWLSKEIHSKVTDPQVGEWISGSASLVKTPREKAILREVKRGYERYAKVPSTLVEALAIAVTQGRQAWEKARAESNFKTFEKELTEILRLKREEAKCVGYEGHLYHAFMEPMEPGMTVTKLEPLFNELKAALIPLLEKIEASKRKPRTEILSRRYPVEKQKKLGEAALKLIGFELNRGRLDVTTHPFCNGMSPADVRLTTRYNENDFGDSFFSTLHEGGHGLYEQGLPPEEFGLATGRAASFGVHESQSRLWENFVGRSEGFWKHYFKEVQNLFPENLKDVSLEEFVFAINGVERSFIRTESDEVTYNLHIILRYELELKLLSGELPVSELPKAWNDKFQAMFGIRPSEDRLGCLQDVHWSMGGFGYFPTYTLGNMLSIQFARRAEKDLGNLESRFAAGDFVSFRDWLRQNIHSKGQTKWANELCEEVTGESISSKPLIDYLNKKFTKLYSL